MSVEGSDRAEQPNANAEANSPPESAAPDSEAATAKQSWWKRLDPARRITLIVLAVVAVVFIWYVVSDRLTPYTAQARVQGHFGRFFSEGDFLGPGAVTIRMKEWRAWSALWVISI